jgi:hypothetical protein
MLPRGQCPASLLVVMDSYESHMEFLLPHMAPEFQTSGGKKPCPRNLGERDVVASINPSPGFWGFLGVFDSGEPL